MNKQPISYQEKCERIRYPMHSRKVAQYHMEEHPLAHEQKRKGRQEKKRIKRPQ
jgi:hypothetical protein